MLWKLVQKIGKQEALVVDKLLMFNNLGVLLSLPESTASSLNHKLRHPQYKITKCGSSKEQRELVKTLGKRLQKIGWNSFYAVENLMKEVVKKRTAGRIQISHVKDLSLLLQLCSTEALVILDKLVPTPAQLKEDKDKEEQRARSKGKKQNEEERVKKVPCMWT